MTSQSIWNALRDGCGCAKMRACLRLVDAGVFRRISTSDSVGGERPKPEHTEQTTRRRRIEVREVSRLSRIFTDRFVVVFRERKHAKSRCDARWEMRVRNAFFKRGIWTEGRV